MNDKIEVESLRVSNRVSLQVFGRLGFLNKYEAEVLARQLHAAAEKITYTDPDTESLATFGDNQPLTANHDEA